MEEILSRFSDKKRAAGSHSRWSYPATAAFAAGLAFIDLVSQGTRPGSMPSVDSEEASRRVETQDNNSLLDLDSLPFEGSFETRVRSTRGGHGGRM